jgi:tRNA(Ile)-lysidine synthase
LVVAISGGPDSVALLLGLIEARHGRSPMPLVLAHLNHQLRGKESDADEAFVVDLHARLLVEKPDLLLRCERFDVGRRAREDGANMEALARRLRYDWLAGVACENRMAWIATGHTANDQAETVLHRLIRGTGIQGLRGIAARRQLTEGIGVVRPLLGVSREDILGYLSHRGQSFRQDASNDDLKHTRNRIRHELIPLLASHYNPAICQVLNRLAAQANEAYADDEAAGRALLRQVELPRAGALVILDKAQLANAPRRLIREAMRLLWVREDWPLGEMGFVAWERLVGLACGEVSALDLPGHVHARSQGPVLQIRRALPED